MARKHAAPAPLPRKLWALPGGLMFLGFVFLVAGAPGIGTAFIFAALGAWLVVVGKARRWKGAPQAGYLLAAIGAVVLILALVDRFTGTV